MIRESFKKTGQFPFDVDKILHNCRVQLPDEEKDHIKQVLPQLTQLMNDQGEIFDTDMDKLNIRKTTEKDGRIVSQRRSCILTDFQFYSRELEVKYQKERQKQEAKAKALLRKENNKRKEQQLNNNNNNYIQVKKIKLVL